VTLRAPSGKSYKFGDNAAGRYQYVDPVDVAWLFERLPLRRVAAPPEPAPAPDPLPIDNEAALEELDALIAADYAKIVGTAAIGGIGSPEAEARELEALRTTDIASPETLAAMIAANEAALTRSTRIAVDTVAESAAPVRRGRK
jgi:hypothetical protein